MGSAVVGAAIWLLAKAGQEGSLSGLGSKLQTSGTLEDWKGRAKQFVGDAAGSGSATAEGTADRVTGAIRTGVGKVASALVDSAPAKEA